MLATDAVLRSTILNCHTWVHRNPQYMWGATRLYVLWHDWLAFEARTTSRNLKNSLLILKNPCKLADQFNISHPVHRWDTVLCSSIDDAILRSAVDMSLMPCPQDHCLYCSWVYLLGVYPTDTTFCFESWKIKKGTEPAWETLMPKHKAVEKLMKRQRKRSKTRLLMPVCIFFRKVFIVCIFFRKVFIGHGQSVTQNLESSLQKPFLLAYLQLLIGSLS